MDTSDMLRPVSLGAPERALFCKKKTSKWFLWLLPVPTDKFLAPIWALSQPVQ